MKHNFKELKTKTVKIKYETSLKKINKTVKIKP